MSLNQQLSSYQNLLLQQTKAEDPVQAIKDAAIVFEVVIATKKYFFPVCMIMYPKIYLV